MALNLKHIAYTDADNLKLDKVNYNFDQLVANGGGPQGFQGSTGEQGFQGITGYQGNQGIEGPQGVQGPQGNNGADIWKVNTGNGQNQLNTLVPQHDLTERPEAPSVVFGYKSNQAEYDQVEENSQVVINKSGPEYQHNLELRSVGVNNKFYFTLDLNEAGNARLSQSFENSGGVYDLYADKFTWFTVDNNQFIDKITLDNQGFRVNIDTILSDTKVEGDLQITSGNPGLNKIAVSGDTNGTLEFRTVEELGGVVPVGTIVSVDPAFVTSDKFITEQIDAAEDATTGLLHVTAGRGIGSFVGWYICNGKTWTDGAVSYATPNLNSFSYSIQQGGTQNGVSETDNAVALIGGADIETTGTYDGTDWNVTMSTDSASTSIGQGSSGTPLTIKRLPQIIYLGASNLYWSQDGPALPEYTFTMWQQAGGSFTTSIPNTGGSITIGQASDGSTAVLNAGDNPTSFGTNPGSSVSYAGYEIQITPPSSPAYANSLVTHTFNVTRAGGYSPAPSGPVTYNFAWSLGTNSTNNVTISNSVNGGTSSTGGSTSVTTGNTGNLVFYIVPDSGYTIDSNDVSITATGGVSVSTSNDRGAVAVTLTSPSLSNNLTTTVNVSGSATVIPPNNIQVNYTLELASEDQSAWSTSTASTYIGAPNGSHNISFEIDYTGSSNVTFNGISTNIGSITTASFNNNTLTGTINISDVGSTSSSQTITLNVDYTESLNQPSLSVSNLSVSGQTSSNPGGLNNTEALTVNVTDGLAWTLSGPDWVSYSPSSDTGTGSNQTVQATISAPTSGSYNSNRSGVTTLSTQAQSGYAAGSATGTIEQDNTFFSATGPFSINIGPEGDTVSYSVMTNVGFSTFNPSGVGDIIPSSSNALNGTQIATATAVDWNIPANNTGSTRSMQISFISGSFSSSFTVHQPSSDTSVSGGDGGGGPVGGSGDDGGGSKNNV